MLAVGLLLSFIIALPAQTALSRETDRTLRLYFPHTGEHGTFTFKRNGRYDPQVLAKLNHFLRDWRKNEDIHIDPHLFDLVWSIYTEAGSHDEIHVVSCYRSPQTNAMLRSRSSGVAKHSQHMLGKAMDWFVTDVPLSKLRATAMKMEGGGVGYYPTSGSPFVHTDTGRVRAWPRMSRQQLIALFPNGGTLHLPADGKPLPGYEQAVAQRESAGSTALAYLEPGESGAAESDKRNGVGAWLKRVLPGGGNDNQEDTADEAPAAGGQMVATADDTTDDDASGDEAEARTPRPRPDAGIAVASVETAPSGSAVAPGDADMIATLAFAPLPKTRPDPMFLASSLGSAQDGARLPVAGNAFVPPAPAAPEADDDPITLAFAAAEENTELPSEEDAAVITAFAALRSAAEQNRMDLASADEADTTTEEASDMGARPIIVAAAMGGPPIPASAAGEVPGIVLAYDQAPVYDADQDAIHRLIAQPAPASDGQFSQLAMPVPADGSAIYQAPDTAEAVTAMNDSSNLPAAHFAGGEPRQQGAQRPGFFMRLFASLIE